MAQERLKDQIEWNPPPSRYANFFNALLILLAMVAVYWAIGDGHIIAPPKLPSSEPTTPSPSQATVLALRVGPNRTFYWNEQGPYSFDEFATRLEAWLPTVTMPHVHITADATARFGDAAWLLKEAQSQGVEQVKLQAHSPVAKP